MVKEPRVAAAFATVGGLLIVAGMIYGFWRVGDGCGSAFAPGTTYDRAQCDLELAGRPASSWQMIIAGAIQLVGALVARRRVPGWW
ncbi:hypothetical protein OG455_16655 [Kitasatospora sp. NBC_01287]|uniref:hypothetical protein n=1 Tax=Kitasatospora sp. NBC_01287 TaxID=2903573 RepID=UPI0022568F22|nr:hypothetical protein [Kitasatospora sp. NBC_01287]MCX4747129.1 hypothetical protein [Kitasatospora sp. NBC_01287]